jgi:predicted glycosyltransferase
LELARGADVCALTITDSPLGAYFGTAPQQDYLKLPSIRKLSPGHWSPIKLPLRFSEVSQLRRELIRTAVLAFDPDVLLVDHMPHGAVGELLPTLEALRARRAATKVVLGLRDIIDAPETVLRVWRTEGAFEALEHFYDLVLVYGERRLFDVATEYRFPEAVVRQTRHCGYLCTPMAARYTRRVRSRYHADGAPRKLVVAMAGGGADAYPMMRALLDALPVVRQRQPVALLVVTGPFMPPLDRHDLQVRAAVCGALIRRSVADPLSYIEAADLVVAMAGYNTTVETLRSGRPTLLIPRPGPSAEQRMRASLFAGSRWVHTLAPEDLRPEAVAQSMLDCLESPPAPLDGQGPDLGGLATAAGHLLSLLERRGAELGEAELGEAVAS